MLIPIVFCVLFTNIYAQVGGDFWCLSPELNNYRKADARPKFEDISELDTDESAKILFRDDDNEEEAYRKNADVPPKQIDVDRTKLTMFFQDKSEMAWPDDIEETAAAAYEKRTENPLLQAKIESEKSNAATTNNDVFNFKFPNHNIVWRDTHVNTTSVTTTTEKTPLPAHKNHTKKKNDADKIYFIENKIPLKVHTKEPAKDTESICTFMKKTECNRSGGVIYFKYESDQPKSSLDHQIRYICCILPVRSQYKSSKIHFREDNKRFKRSNKDEQINGALKQRNTLLQRRFGSTINRPDAITKKPNRKVVTPADDYVDPYWNIKSSDFQSSSRQPHSVHQTKDDYYGSEDYEDDYLVEVPSPGLVGLYSDHGPSKPAWSFPSTSPYGGSVDSIEDEENIGYAPTLDPRLEDRLATTRPRVSIRPVKLTTQEDEKSYDIETQTLSYQSNPDFQVFEGFKLLNLGQNKSRIIRTGKKTTTENIIVENSQEHVLTSSLEDDFKEEFDKNTQVRHACGKVMKGVNQYYDPDKEIGETARGTHPFLALVVLTKRRHNILCYATIVHARAAVTAADCVYGRASPGELTTIAGAWRLNDESQEKWQKRMSSVLIHLRYTPGKLGNNLALLYWNRPLRFNGNVQPACLADPYVGEHCKFFGWGGYDQAIKKQSKWQRATILTASTCSQVISSNDLPKDAFCASVEARGTVTGVGGPLICAVGRRQSVVGVAVWRDVSVVLLPAHEWTLQALRDLKLDSRDDQRFVV